MGNELSQADLVQLSAGASTLWERLAPRRADGDRTTDRDPIAAWADALGGADALARRLAMEGLTAEHARTALASPPTEIASWAHDLARAVREAAWDRPHLAATPPLAFEDALAPLARYATDRLTARLGGQLAPLGEAAIAALERRLLTTLCRLAEQPLFARFAARRSARTSTLGRMLVRFSTEPGRVIYDELITDLGTGGLRDVLLRHPMLARLMATALQQWETTTAEFVERLRSDGADLAATFARGKGASAVRAVTGGLSDRHHGGHQVLLLELDDGTRVVYKPRSLAPEQAFAQFIAICRQHGLPVELRLPRMVMRDGHGWVEHVAHAPCSSEADVVAFYDRLGVLLALLHALRATDMHCENVIASAGEPVLIDLETILHPESVDGAPASDDGELSPAGARALVSSVVQTTLVPSWGQRAGMVLDLSALGGIEGTLCTAPVLTRLNTDAMDIALEAPVPPPSTNLPVLDGEPVRCEGRHVEDFVAGFARGYRWLLAQREPATIAALLAPFEGLATRVILRDTMVYAGLLGRLLAPASLADGLRASLELEALARPSVAGAPCPRIAAVLRDEQQALLGLDIPHFVALTSEDRPHAPARALQAGWFRAPGLAAVRARIAGLSEDDRARQENYIRGSLHARFYRGPHSAVTAPAAAGRRAGDARTGDLLARALAIGDELLRYAEPGDAPSERVWLAPAPIAGQEQLQLTQISHSFYDGAVGVAVFFAALARTTGDARWRGHALGAVGPTLRALAAAGNAPASWMKARGIGGGTGAGSVVYGLTQLAQLLDHGPLLAEARRAARLVTRDRITADTTLDAVGGTAGCALGLAALQQVSPDPDVLALLHACADHLVASRFGVADARVLSGLSHGLAGIALAAARLALLLADRDLAAHARAVLVEENRGFLPERSNWRSVLRGETDGDRAPDRGSWCHGAPGIGLARLALLDWLPDPIAERDVLHATTFTERAALLPLDSLCCGNLGRAELAWTAGRRLASPALCATARRILDEVLARADRHGRFALQSNGFCFPGFHQGLSGIGYQLLRFHDPAAIPSLLAWQ